jgi:hypothetical protein
MNKESVMSDSTSDTRRRQRVLGLAALVASALVAVGCPARPTPPTQLPPPATVVSFTANPAQLTEPGPVVLSWEVAHASSVTLTTLTGEKVEGVEPGRATGSVTTEVAEDTFFILTAHGQGGSDTAVAGISVAGNETSQVLFAVAPGTITSGEGATLVWSVPVGTVSISSGGEGVIGTGARSGSVRVSPAFTTEYQLTAGEQTASVTVNVRPAVHGFSTDLGSAEPGEEVTVSWSVGGATRVALSAEGRGELFATTDPGQMVDGSFVDTVPAELPARNGLVRYQLTAESPSFTVTRELTLWVGVDPVISQLAVPPYAKEGASFPVSWSIVGADRVEVSLDGQVVFVTSTAAQAIQHTLQLATPAAAAIVSLRATSSRGGAMVQAEPVEPVGLPSIASFTATPNPLPNGGDPVILDWVAPNARNLTVREKATGKVVFTQQGLAAEQGQAEVSANKPTVFQLTADNTVGDAVASEVTVTVTTPAKLVFSPAEAPAGATVTITGSTAAAITELHGLPAVRNMPGTGFVDILNNGGVSIAYSGTDTSAKLVTLPETFNFPLFGQVVGGNQISFSINGWFAFRSASFSGPDVATFLPSSALPEFAILPFMEDLRDVNGEIYYRFDTVAGVRRLIVQWENVQIDLNNTAVNPSSFTFQAQVYADGRIVFAYKTLQGLTTQVPSIGVQDGTFTRAATARIIPAEGDTITLFGQSALPVDIIVQVSPFTVTGVSPTFEIEIEETYPVIAPGTFYISEVNPQPDVTAPLGEWFEVTNTANRTYDLTGWTMVTSAGQTHTIPQSAALVLPANGTLLFAPSADPVLNGGIAPDYVYPATLTLPDTAGSVALRLGGARYGGANWQAGSGHGAGVSARFDPRLADHQFIAGVIQSSCPGTGTYGLQTGSPGTRIPGCFPYRMENLAQGAFEPLANNGGTHLNGTQTQDFIVTLSTQASTLPAPITWGNKTYNTLTVSDNGYIALRDVPNEPVFACTVTNCHSGNKTAFNNTAPTRLVAPFWDLLSAAPVPAGMYFKRVDPDPAVTGDEYSVVSWENWRYGTTTTYDLNFQVKFFDKGDIEYHYGTMNGPSATIVRGSSATVWLESEDGRAALVHTITTNYGPGVDPNSGIRFRFVP